MVPNHAHYQTVPHPDFVLYNVFYILFCFLASVLWYFRVFCDMIEKNRILFCRLKSTIDDPKGEKHMISEEELLSALPFADKINKKMREVLLKSFRKVVFPAGERLFTKEEIAFFIVRKGTVQVFTGSENGEEFFLYRIGKEDGCTVSEDLIYYFPAQTELLLLSAEGFETALTSAQCAAFFMQSAMKQEEKTLNRINAVMFAGIDKRLSDFLLSATRNKGKSIFYTHEQIARFIGTSREVVTRKLKALEEEGLVEVSRGRVTVLNREELKKRK